MAEVIKQLVTQPVTPSRRRKRFVVAGVAAAVVVLGGIAAWMVLMPKEKPVTSPHNMLDFTAFKQSQELKDSGKYDQAAQYAAEQYAAATSKDQKYALALQVATSYESKQDYKSALKWYQAAASIDDTQRATASGMARCYDKLGDKAKAAEYYQETIDRIDRRVPGSDNDVKYYQMLLKKAQAAQ